MGQLLANEHRLSRIRATSRRSLRKSSYHFVSAQLRVCDLELPADSKYQDFDLRFMVTG